PGARPLEPERRREALAQAETLVGERGDRAVVPASEEQTDDGKRDGDAESDEGRRRRRDLDEAEAVRGDEDERRPRAERGAAFEVLDGGAERHPGPHVREETTRRG